MEDQALYQWIDNGKPSSVRVQRTKSSIPEGKKIIDMVVRYATRKRICKETAAEIIEEKEKFKKCHCCS
jgi:hypothetical protein